MAWGMREPHCHGKAGFHRPTRPFKRSPQRRNQCPRVGAWRAACRKAPLVSCLVVRTVRNIRCQTRVPKPSPGYGAAHVASSLPPQGQRAVRYLSELTGNGRTAHPAWAPDSDSVGRELALSSRVQRLHRWAHDVTPASTGSPPITGRVRQQSWVAPSIQRDAPASTMSRGETPPFGLPLSTATALQRMSARNVFAQQGSDDA